LGDPFECPSENRWTTALGVGDQHGRIIVKRPDEVSARERPRVKRCDPSEVLPIEHENGLRLRGIVSRDPDRAMSDEIYAVRLGRCNGGIRSGSILNEVETCRPCTMMAAGPGERRRKCAPIDIAVAKDQWRIDGTPFGGSNSPT
jgi:hypothetical protein